MIFENPYWEAKTKIELLQRWILVHSFLYYDLDKSVVSDQMFDNNCSQLLYLKTTQPEEYERSTYRYAMKDFDGSTGFGFVNNLEREDRDLIVRDAANLADGIIK